MDKNEIQHLINIKSERVSCEANCGKLSSDVWKRMKMVIYLLAAMTGAGGCQVCGDGAGTGMVVAGTGRVRERWLRERNGYGFHICGNGWGWV